MSGGMDYEYAIRYVFDRSGRGGGPQGAADADLWRHNDWASVREALGASLERISTDAADINWSEADERGGGVAHNFRNPLDGAASAIRQAQSEAELYRIIALLTHSLKAVVLKAGGSVPEEYEGET